ncbi:DUF4178 domain-containing protein [Pseudanabaena sp. FACHB-1998]|uniref:DUF4178 domain-containing protein n=1 Tax=Pseudanabaena sp. FACHB-1998 TaxID=2692858 RepID=UPI00167FE966|nr:DUF4178 domain-containing protein [Pseudanabaena sp. FACHB-1998]MBD2175373.1 DUF4178 domain-containing protein [Pseudanabaena sp. FACHB-1998]
MNSSLDTDYISFLPRLRAGDRVIYGGIQWEIEDFSTYDDADGYETMEWLLKSNRSSYYLLREVDPENPETKVNWYLSEEIGVNRVSTDHVGDNVQFALWDVMLKQGEPYLKLRAMGRVYYFESQTEGNYNSVDGTESRTTWDYWDEQHLWNLAIEAWRDRELHVYSTKKVSPTEFTIADKVEKPQSFIFQNPTQPKAKANDRTWEIICAWTLIIIGFILMTSGDW